ncbi:discoidin domain-containing protein [Streptomyces sp. NPDC088768]|uniref:discoidin domain-containing protein n=1 Tax=Streptomyces sp. NPDC088768 TaxID=3365894 RepID=UPI0038235F6E
MRHPTRRRTRRLPRLVRLVASLGVLALVPALLPAAGAHAAEPAGRVLHVAVNGDDSHDGSASAPYRTIDKAAQVARPGDTVSVHAGLYRETVKPARGGTDEQHRITYTSAGDGEVVVKGSEEVNSWTRASGDVWSVSLPDSYFGDYNPYATGQPQGGGGQTFPGYTAGDVYFEEDAYAEQPDRGKVDSTPRGWFAEVGGGRTTIYANFDGADPNTGLAEINVRRQVFAPDAWGLGYVTVRGFTVMHAANTYSDFPDSPTRRQAGAISVNGGRKWIIERNTVLNARTIGIDIGLGNDEWAGNRPGTTRTDFHDTSEYGEHIVRDNYLARCGQSGIAGVFSWKSQILWNRIEDTNYRNEFSGAETAPIKVHYMNDGLIKGNLVRNSQGGNSAGIWTDWGNQHVRITGNIVMNSPWGYYAEAVHGPILVDNNVFIGNSDIRTLDATGVVFAHNLFLDNNRINIDGEGRDAYYFQPGTMNESSAVTSPQKFYWFNNLVQDTALPQDAPDKTHVKDGNVEGAVSGVDYTADAAGVRLDFTLDTSRFPALTPVTEARVGPVPRANQGIPGDVTTDFFDRPVDTTHLLPGPFAGAHDGRNTVTLWPPAGRTVPPVPAPRPGTPRNLSLGADAKATASHEDGDLTAGKAIDGRPATRWSSDKSGDDTAWLAVDLGAPYDLSRVSLSWEAAYADSYRVQVSDDGTTWRDAANVTGGRGGTETVAVRERARHVRMRGITSHTPYGYSLYEFAVYGSAGTTAAKGPVLYTDGGYAGTSAVLAPGDHDLPALRAAGLGNDSVSSLRVPAGWTVTAYADAGFTGTRWVFTGDTPDLVALGANDRISSVRVSGGAA